MLDPNNGVQLIFYRCPKQNIPSVKQLLLRTGYVIYGRSSVKSSFLRMTLWRLLRWSKSYLDKVALCKDCLKHSLNILSSK